jgi:hypothetical protein
MGKNCPGGKQNLPVEGRLIEIFLRLVIIEL